jgi:hypothetical protein
LTRAYHRVAGRIVELEERLEADPSAWSEFYIAVHALAAIEPRLGHGDMLTTGMMAQRLGLSVKTLLKHKKSGAIQPAVVRGKLIRWRGNEALNGNGNGNGTRK